MKLRLALPPLLLALAACSQDPTPSAPPPKKTVAVTPWTHYVCADGRTLSARYPDGETAQIQLGRSMHVLRIARSGSGARYVGDALQWWTKGDWGMLAPLKPGEEIASAPGVNCVPPERAPVEPPA